MPRKNKEEYNDYMRNYMKKKNRETSGKPVLDDDFDPSSAGTDGRPTLDLRDTAKLVRQTRKMLDNPSNKEDNSDDPILRAIDRYGKYVPLIMEFVKGLQGSLAQANQSPQQQQQSRIQAPQGWLNMSPMQRINYKYSRPEWYAAGEAYENMADTGYMNPQVNTSYVDAGYRQPPPQNLQALSRKYPEPPMVTDNAPKTSEPVKEPVQQELPPQEKETGKADAIVAELQADNMRYITLGADFLNNMTPADFKKALEDIDALILKLKPFVPLIPVQVKGMIFQTSKEEFDSLLKEKCPKKYAQAKKLKKLEQINELIEKLKQEIKPQ
jgi:hypothetical protein